MTHQNVRCLIVEDKADCQHSIVSYVRRIPFLEVIANFSSAVDALFYLSEVGVDIIFINIDLPDLGGLDFVKLLPQIRRPAVVVITESPSYAIESFEQRVADYLLSPFTFERFLRAVCRIFPGKQLAKIEINSIGLLPDQLPVKTGQSGDHSNVQSDALLFRENKKLITIEFKEILFIEGMKDYFKIHRNGIVSVIHMTMTKIEQLLPEDLFVRVNRSYIIRKAAIREIEGNVITLLYGKKIAIGATYKSAVIHSFQKIII